jgi:hypothetical protein
MQDAVNLSHVLGFSLREDGGDNKDNDRRRIAARSWEVQTMTSFAADSWRPSLNCGTPPSLDEGYWKAKEGLVLTKQHVLCMIQFDATACHPHQCVLGIMETLGFGVGRGYTTTGGGRALRCSIRSLRYPARPYRLPPPPPTREGRAMAVA